jgi:hypothetical protein
MSVDRADAQPGHGLPRRRGGRIAVVPAGVQFCLYLLCLQPSQWA